MCIYVYMYMDIMYILYHPRRVTTTTIPVEGPQREKVRERKGELPDIVPALVLCEICSSAKIIFRPNGGGAG